MSKCGFKQCIWTKEMDDQLISEISKGKTMASLEITMKTSRTTIDKRLKQMGFDNFRNARNIMTEPTFN